METTLPLQEYLAQKRVLVEQSLETYLPALDAYPPIIYDAMRYSIFAGGKRLRPILVLMTAELFGRSVDSVTFAAAAIEMIHTYSLIHDDLPAMDNDDLRRGKPTSHKVYGEDIAILAGDALLTLAFQVMADPRHTAACRPTACLKAAYELALAAGAAGMVGGQVMDMQAERRAVTTTELDYIHNHKTAKLLRAALRMGALLADADDRQLKAVTMYGEHVGLAFQIVDDILDIEGDPAQLGKNIQGDLEKKKATYPALYGVAASKTRVRELIADAKNALRLFDQQAHYFMELAEYMCSRTY